MFYYSALMALVILFMPLDGLLLKILWQVSK